MLSKLSRVLLLLAILNRMQAEPITSQATQPFPGLNTSVLPPGWTGSARCMEDFTVLNDPGAPYLLGPQLTSPIMTVELCVEFCDSQGFREAGVIRGDGCHCGNFDNPFTGLESEGNSCVGIGALPCVGNPAESCGSVDGQFLNIYQKGNMCTFWRSGQFDNVILASGPWRFVYFYNDTVGARALPHNAVDLHPSLPRGNLTIEACVNECATAGFLLAGVEFADECYCGNATENGSQAKPSCLTDPNSSSMPCKGDPTEGCGGPNLLYLYTLPGSVLQPLLPFDPFFDDFDHADD